MGSKTIDRLFDEIRNRFVTWLNKKATGKFVIEININQGGIIGKPKITITENI